MLYIMSMSPVFFSVIWTNLSTCIEERMLDSLTALFCFWVNIDGILIGLLLEVTKKHTVRSVRNSYSDNRDFRMAF